MTTPAAPPISISQMATEFGLATPVAFSQLLGKGGAPAAAPLKFSDMLGRSAPPAVTFSLNPGTYSYSTPIDEGPTVKTITASQAVLWTWTRNPASQQFATGTTPSGTTATQVTLSQGAGGINASARSSTYTLTATFNGTVVGTWTITVSASSSGSGGGGPGGGA